LFLGHVWSSENLGNDWERLVRDSVRTRELDCWKTGLQKKAKLRLYRTLKSELRREEYLDLPQDIRVRLTELRCGTHRLRVETGRWEKEELAERVCRVCVCGPVEDELHVLLDCYVYRDL